jgi:glucokinase
MPSDARRIEAYVGGTALAEQYGQPAAALFRNFRDGEPAARKRVLWAARIFARGLVSLTALLDPSVIVIGGSIALHNWEILAPLVDREFRAYYPVLTRQVRLRRSVLGEHLGDIAALSLVMPDEWTDPYQHTKPWVKAPPAVALPGHD